jgi:hypothetical protein
MTMFPIYLKENHKSCKRLLSINDCYLVLIKNLYLPQSGGAKPLPTQAPGFLPFLRNPSSKPPLPLPTEMCKNTSKFNNSSCRELILKITLSLNCPRQAFVWRFNIFYNKWYYFMCNLLKLYFLALRKLELIFKRNK